MPELRNKLCNIIHKGLEPFHEFDYQESNVNLFNGWNSENPEFAKLLRSKAPNVYVETGTFLGGSAIKAASIMKEMGIDGAVICVDTFLGCHYLHQMDEWRPTLKFKNARPDFYTTFMSNVMKLELQNYVIPVSLPSHSGARLLKDLKIQADFVYIDASHVEGDVLNDLREFWPLTKVGGIFCGDDYKSAEETFPGKVIGNDHVNNFNGLIRDWNRMGVEVDHPMNRAAEKVWIERRK